MKPLIQVKNLGKSFNGKKVLKNVPFDLYEGEILCLLGPNGGREKEIIKKFRDAMKSSRNFLEYYFLLLLENNFIMLNFDWMSGYFFYSF